MAVEDEVRERGGRGTADASNIYNNNRIGQTNVSTISRMAWRDEDVSNQKNCWEFIVPGKFYATRQCNLRFVEDPGQEQWQAAKRVLRYLQGTRHEDRAGDEDSRKSTAGHVFFINDSPVSWSSKRQTSMTLSTVEAEYIATTTAAQEARYLRNIMHDMGEVQTTPTIVRSDTGSLALAKNPTHHSRTKHIDIRAHFIREQIEHQVDTQQRSGHLDAWGSINTKQLR